RKTWAWSGSKKPCRRASRRRCWTCTWWSTRSIEPRPARAGPGRPSELRRAAVRAPTKTLVDDTPSACYNEPCSRRGQIAQPVRALRSHRRGRGFESLSAHQVKTPSGSRFPEGVVLLVAPNGPYFAAKLRPFATFSDLRHELVHVIGRLLVHSREQVAVEIVGDCDPFVSQTLGDRLDVDLSGDQHAGVGVPKRVECNAGE